MDSRQIGVIDRQLDAMTALLTKENAVLQRQIAPVSGWSIAEHLDHSARVCSSILGRVLKPEGATKRPISLVGKIILMLGYIPRGKGRSPEPFRAKMLPSSEIAAVLDETRSLLRTIESREFTPVLDPIVPHPVFGGLTAPQALRFAVIHTNHHMKIVRDIEKHL